MGSTMAMQRSPCHAVLPQQHAAAMSTAPHQHFQTRNLPGRGNHLILMTAWRLNSICCISGCAFRVWIHGISKVHCEIGLACSLRLPSGCPELGANRGLRRPSLRDPPEGPGARAASPGSAAASLCSWNTAPGVICSRLRVWGEGFRDHLQQAACLTGAVPHWSPEP